MIYQTLPMVMTRLTPGEPVADPRHALVNHQLFTSDQGVSFFANTFTRFPVFIGWDGKYFGFRLLSRYSGDVAVYGSPIGDDSLLALEQHGDDPAQWRFAHLMRKTRWEEKYGGETGRGMGVGTTPDGRFAVRPILWSAKTFAGTPAELEAALRSGVVTLASREKINRLIDESLPSVPAAKPAWHVDPATAPAPSEAVANRNTAIEKLFRDYGIKIGPAIFKLAEERVEHVAIYRDGIHMGSVGAGFQSGGMIVFTEETLSKSIALLCQIPDLWAKQQAEITVKAALAKLATKHGVTFGAPQGAVVDKYGRTSDRQFAFGIYRDGAHWKNVSGNTPREFEREVAILLRNEAVEKLYADLNITIGKSVSGSYARSGETLGIYRDGVGVCDIDAGNLSGIGTAKEVSAKVAAVLGIADRYTGN